MTHSPSKKARFYFLIMILSFLLLGACASTELHYVEFFEGESGSTLQWPPPPQKPRIFYTGSIRDPRENEIKTSWLQRFINGVFGAEKAMPVMVRPYGVYADGNRVYAADPGAGTFHVYDLTAKRYFAVERAGDEELISPIGIAADAKGNIYVSDSELRKILIFDAEGKYLRAIGSSELFQRPAGIALSGNRIYVADTHAHTVFVLSSADGGFLFAFGGRGTEIGKFNYPTNIFVSGNKFLYVTDSMNFRVQIFDSDGNFISSFGKHGDGSGNFSKPKGIAVDSDGHIYVADSHFDNVQIFDENGALLLDFGSPGSGRGEFTLPSGMYIDGRDRIYVSDSYNRRIQIFQYVKEGEKIGDSKP